MNALTLANKLSEALGPDLVATVTVKDVRRFLDGHSLDPVEDALDRARTDARESGEEHFVLIRVQP